MNVGHHTCSLTTLSLFYQHRLRGRLPLKTWSFSPLCSDVFLRYRACRHGASIFFFSQTDLRCLGMKALQCKLLVSPAAELSQPKQFKVGPEASCLSLDAAKAPLDGINTTIRPRKSSPNPSVNTAGWELKEASALARRPQRPWTAWFPSGGGFTSTTMEWRVGGALLQVTLFILEFSNELQIHKKNQTGMDH